VAGLWRIPGDESRTKPRWRRGRSALPGYRARSRSGLTGLPAPTGRSSRHPSERYSASRRARAGLPVITVRPETDEELGGLSKFLFR